MELREALNTLGERETKKILDSMFSSLMSLNAQGKGAQFPLFINNKLQQKTRESEGRNVLVPIWRGEMLLSPYLPQLVNNAYDILNEEGFDNPDRWYEEIYLSKVHPELDLTIKDMIEALRQQRARSTCEYIGADTLPDGAKILDYGVGSGTNMLELARQRPDVTIHGFDPNNYVREELLSSGQFKHISKPEDLEGDYDCIVLSWVLHHAPESEHQAILETIHDNLRPNGNFIFLETLISEKAASSFEEQKRQYAAAILKDAVSSNGMLPKYPYTGTEISGYYDRDYWENTLSESGFGYDKKDRNYLNAYLSKEMDVFTEQSLFLKCQKADQSPRHALDAETTQEQTHSPI